VVTYVIRETGPASPKPARFGTLARIVVHEGLKMGETSEEDV
jgi:hypothetical protein